MTYIKLEDINNLLWDKALKSRGDDTIMYINIKDDINSLPQYNPEEVLREMISHQRARKAITNVTDAYNNGRLDVLEEILTRIAPNK